MIVTRAQFAAVLREYHYPDLAISILWEKTRAESRLRGPEPQPDDPTLASMPDNWEARTRYACDAHPIEQSPFFAGGRPS